jgi:hypothetical protein
MIGECKSWVSFCGKIFFVFSISSKNYSRAFIVISIKIFHYVKIILNGLMEKVEKNFVGSRNPENFV